MVASTIARGGGALAVGVRARDDAGRDRRGAALARARRRAVSQEDARRRAAAAPRQRAPGRAPSVRARSCGAARSAPARARRARIARGLGEPALFAILLSSVVSGLFMVLGVVAGDALGLTPVAFLAAGLFFVLTIATYVEGSSLHPERGGASTFARYAFDELWSFIAGWAILLDYLIVMAIGAVAISDYLAVFWTDLDEGVVEVVIAGLALVFVAAAERARPGRRPARHGPAPLAARHPAAGRGRRPRSRFAQNWDPAAITDSVDLGSAPEWDQLLFATVVAGVALIGVEAASGLAGEVRVGRRGLRRVVRPDRRDGAGAVRVRVDGGADDAAGGGRRDAARRALRRGAGARRRLPVPPDLAQRRGARRGRARSAQRLLLVAMNSQMLGIARLSYSLATNRQIPSAAGRLHERRGTPYIAITLAAAIAFLLAVPHDLDFLAGIFAFGAMVTFAIAHVSVIVLRYRESEPAERVPRAALDAGRPRQRSRCRRCSARSSRSSPGSAWSCCTRARA